MVLINAIHKLSDLLDRVAEVIIVVILGAMVVITGAQIVCRIFFTSLSWSEEATRYLLIWGTLLGAGCVYKHAGHISITVLMDSLKGTAGNVLRILVHVLCFVLFLVIVRYGILYFGKQGNQVSAALRLPMRYVYTCIPIGAAVMALHALDAILQILFGFQKEDK